MEHDKKQNIQELFPGFFKNELTGTEISMVNNWRQMSKANEEEFRKTKKVWDLTETLNQMTQFDTSKALDRFRDRINSSKKISLITFQRVAAILILPLLVYAGISFYNQHNSSEDIGWQEYAVKPGMHAEFTLPDGSHVWLNTGSSIRFPLSFKKIRNVQLTGEAFFDVKHDDRKPFIVNAGKINVEVLGTRFDVVNYENEDQVEVILESGKVNLFSGDYGNKKDLGCLKPGDRMIYSPRDNSLFIENVNVRDYTSWKEGVLVFNDAKMEDVTRKLSRWFNTDIEIADDELGDYVYTATFHHESLDQILDLLKLSAPLDYKVEKRKELDKGIFSEKRIWIYKKGPN